MVDILRVGYKFQSEIIIIIRIIIILIIIIIIVYSTFLQHKLNYKAGH